MPSQMFFLFVIATPRHKSFPSWSPRIISRNIFTNIDCVSSAQNDPSVIKSESSDKMHPEQKKTKTAEIPTQTLFFCTAIFWFEKSIFGWLWLTLGEWAKYLGRYFVHAVRQPVTYLPTWQALDTDISVQTSCFLISCTKMFFLPLNLKIYLLKS